MSMENNAPPSDKRPGKRTRNFAILLLILILAAGGCLAWYLLYARYYESTDDAYVNGNQVTLTPQITGTVTQVTVDEGDYVEKGQPLVLLDPSDTAIALQQAEANLASTVRQVRGLYSTADNYRAQVAAVVWSQLRMREETTQSSPVDYIGIALLVLGVGLLQVVLDKGNDEDWFSSTPIIVMSIVSAISLICFVIWELDERHPIVNLRLFKDRNFAIGTLALMLGYAAFFAINIILPQWLQTQMGYTAIWAGLAAAPMGFLPLVLTPVIGRYATKVDLRILCSVSFLTMGASCLMRAQFNTDVDFRTIASVQMFMGIGVAFFFMPLTTIVLSNLHGNEVAEGSGLATFFRVLGGSFASSLTTWIWQRREVFHHANLTESVTQYNPAAMDYVNKMGGPTQQHLAMIDQVVTQQAYMMSTIDYFWVLGWGFMALIIIIWFTRPPFVKSGMPGAPAAGH